MSRANKRDTKPEEKVEVAPVTPPETADVEVTPDVAAAVETKTAAEQETGAETDVDAKTDTEDDTEPTLPDHLAHRVSLEEYGRLRGLNAFGQAHLTRAVGTYNRPFEEWEAARQNVIGG